MIERTPTDYEAFERESPEHRRLLRQEDLIFRVTESLSEMLQREGITKSELAKRLGKTKGFVSQLLSGSRNLTLRTISDVAGALAYDVHFRFAREERVDQVWRSETAGWKTPSAPWHIPQHVPRRPDLTEGMAA